LPFLRHLANSQGTDARRVQ